MCEDATPPTKQDILDIVDTMVSAAASFNGQGYAELIKAREILTCKLDAVDKVINASKVLDRVISALDSGYIDDINKELKRKLDLKCRIERVSK